MARPLRMEYEGAVCHVTARGNERNKIFFSKTDYEKFLQYLREAKNKYNIQIHCYVLMSNHYHLLIETHDSNLSRVMHYVNGSYSTYINVKKKRSGHLFQGRYKSIVVERDNYLLELSRYIHLNPVRAGMVQKPEEYKYSSYEAYIKGRKKEILTGGLVLGLMLRRNGNSRNEYRIFVESAIGKELDNPMDKVYGGLILGGTRFVKEILGRVKDDHRRKEDIANKKALRAYVGIQEVMEAVSAYYAIGRNAIITGSSSEQRKIAIYLMKERTGATNGEIGKMFGGLNSSAVRKVYQRFKKKMQDSRKLRGIVNKIDNSLSLVRG